VRCFSNSLSAVFEMSDEPSGNEEVWYAVYCAGDAENSGRTGVPGHGFVVWGLVFKLSCSSTEEAAGGCSSTAGELSIDTLFLIPRLDFMK
jgi:hypothetical protein